MWQDRRLGSDRAASHVIHRKGPWARGPANDPTPWSLETIVQVPIGDLRLGPAREDHQPLWLAGAWNTVLRGEVPPSE